MRPLLRWLLFHPRSAQAVTNIVSWRTEGIKYKKNEVFLDVVERLNLLVAANGSVLSSEILGAIKMRSFLSGMPELKLGLNDKALLEAQGSAAGKKGVEMEDIKFHQCVRLTRVESDRTISFIPPDGDFELMSYRLNTTVRACAMAVTGVLAVTLILPVQVKPLIWVEAVIETHGRSRVEYLVKAKSQFKTKSYANNVEVYIPVPADVDRPAFKASLGTVTYVPDLDAIKWTIKQVRARGPSASVAVSMRLDKLASLSCAVLSFTAAATPSCGRTLVFRQLRQTNPMLTSGAREASASSSKCRTTLSRGFRWAGCFEQHSCTCRGGDLCLGPPATQVKYLKILEKSGYAALPWVRYM